MKSEDNYFEYISSSKSNLKKNNLTIDENSLSPKKIESNKIQIGPYYLGGNYPKKENNNYSIIKDELENKNKQKIDNILTKDIISSFKAMKIKFKKNFTKNKSMEDIYVEDKTKSYEDEKDSSLINNKSDNIDIKNIKIKNEFVKEFSFNLNINKSFDFHLKNNLTDETEQINHNNRYLNND